MSVGVRRYASGPTIRISSARTMNVYGRASAILTRPCMAFPGEAEVVQYAGRYLAKTCRLHETKVMRCGACVSFVVRSEEHTSELPSLMRISYAVFCLKKK